MGVGHLSGHLAKQGEQAEQASSLLGLDPALDELLAEAGGELDITVKDLDRHLAALSIKDGGDLDLPVDGAVKVVGRAAVGVGVEGALGLGVAGRKNFKDIKLAAARLPAGAVAILLGAGDFGVQGPDGRHVTVETALSVERHVKLEEEHLGVAREAI